MTLGQDSQSKRDKILEEIITVLKEINEREPKRGPLSEKDKIKRLNKVLEILRELNEK